MNVAKVVYLAGPVDWSNSNANRFKEEMATALLAKGFVVYDPYGPWKFPGPIDQVQAQTLVGANASAMMSIGRVVAVLPPETATVGTILEIAEATRAGVPTVVWTPGEHRVSLVAQALGWNCQESLDAVINQITAEIDFARSRNADNGEIFDGEVIDDAE